MNFVWKIKVKATPLINMSFVCLMLGRPITAGGCAAVLIVAKETSVIVPRYPFLRKVVMLPMFRSIRSTLAAISATADPLKHVHGIPHFLAFAFKPPATRRPTHEWNPPMPPPLRGELSISLNLRQLNEDCFGSCPFDPVSWHCFCRQRAFHPVCTDLIPTQSKLQKHLLSVRSE